jgi:MoxR-like ATPase
MPTQELYNKLANLRSDLTQVLFDREDLLDGILCGILAGGHILLESLPGLGKTELIKAFGQLVDFSVRRVQFTPDLLPGDITGSTLLQGPVESRQFVFHPGPIFCNVLLADEINRASPKTQAALLEAMQELKVTIAGETHQLPSPFFVMATQNPIDLEGTYPLPEAQLDRFIMKLHIGPASLDALLRIVDEREVNASSSWKPVLDASELLEMIEAAKRVYLAPVIRSYIARLVHALTPGNSKTSRYIKFGASPRGAIGLAACTRAYALLNARSTCDFNDVQAVAPLVLNHRIILNYDARVAGKTPLEVIEELLAEISPYESELPPEITISTHKDSC